MSIQLSPALERNRPLVERVLRANQVVEPLLRQHSQTASGYWDFRRDRRGRDLLNLAISDPWGYASGDFAPDELENPGAFHRRVYALIREMLNPAPRGTDRARIEIRDAFVTTDQLEDFRRRLEHLPGLEGAGLKLHNQVRFAPNRPDAFLLTDFAIEVNRDRAEDVRRVIQESGFHPREDAPILQRAGVRDAVKQLVERHRAEGQAAPRFAICFRTQDTEDIHLLEVTDDLEEMSDSSLEGVGFNANASIPGARTVVIYLTHPNDLRRAHQSRPEHRFFETSRRSRP
jgi:hypothetical protein